MSDCSCTQHALILNISTYLFGCYMLVIHEIDALYAPYSHVPVYSVTLFEAKCIGCIHVCLAVTCHMHFWQNKILPPLLLGLKSETF